MTNISAAARRKLEEPFALLAARLRTALGNRRMMFMQNIGNFGDGLIRYGTIRFFEDLGLRFTNFDMEKPGEKIICILKGMLDRVTNRYLFVYSGNGAWSQATDCAYRYVKRQRMFTRNLFVLPTTFAAFNMNFDFPAFARDRFQSMDFLEGGPFCHDMAFYLALVAPDRLLPNRQPATKKTGFMFRVDREKYGHGMETWPNNFDISTTGGHRSDPQDFLRYIDQYEHILTDRLHVGIAGALLGKKVTLLSGNYFKIKAIYNSSIADIFDNVEFIESATPAMIEEYQALAA